MSSSSGKRDLGRIDLSRSAPMAVSIKNLDAPLGAQVGGIDLAEHLTRADLQAIEEAWQTRLVIVARRQRLSDPQLLAFSRRSRCWRRNMLLRIGRDVRLPLLARRRRSRRRSSGGSMTAFARSRSRSATVVAPCL